MSHSVLNGANIHEAASFGLKINSGKTKSMCIVNSSTTGQPRPNVIVLNGHPVEEVLLTNTVGTAGPSIVRRLDSV